MRCWVLGVSSEVCLPYPYTHTPISKLFSHTHPFPHKRTHSYPSPVCSQSTCFHTSFTVLCHSHVSPPVTYPLSPHQFFHYLHPPPLYLLPLLPHLLPLHFTPTTYLSFELHFTPFPHHTCAHFTCSLIFCRYYLFFIASPVLPPEAVCPLTCVLISSLYLGFKIMVSSHLSFSQLFFLLSFLYLSSFSLSTSLYCYIFILPSFIYLPLIPSFYLYFSILHLFL